jgi:hypothetical protein
MSNNGNLIAILITGIIFYIGKTIHEWREEHGHHAPSLSHLSHETWRKIKAQVRRETPRETPRETRRDETPEVFDDIDDEDTEMPIFYGDEPVDENHIVTPTTSNDNPCKRWVREVMSSESPMTPGEIARIANRDFNYSRATVYRYMTEIRNERN